MMSGILLRLRALAAPERLSGRSARRVLAVAVFVLLTAAGAYLAVPLPGTAVPVTFQAMVVILAGALLGPRLGAASQAAYLMAGAAGIPVFAAGRAGIAYLLGPTGGYLIAFPAAAYLVGVLAGPVPGDRTARLPAVLRTLRLGAALVAGSAVILAGGAAQLTVLTGDAARAVQLGVLPFLLGDLLKVVAALLIASRLRARTLGSV